MDKEHEAIYEVLRDFAIRHLAGRGQLDPDASAALCFLTAEIDRVVQRIDEARGVVIIDGPLLESFQAKYGTLVGLKLVVFYLNWMRGGESKARLGVRERTFYHYRKILYRDGFLTDGDIKSGGNARWINSA